MFLSIVLHDFTTDTQNMLGWSKLIVISLICLANVHGVPKMDINQGLDLTVNALDKLLSFYEQEIEKVNLDAIYGLRVAEGAMSASLAEHDDLFWKSSSSLKIVHEKLISMRQHAASLSEQAQGFLKNQSKKYYREFKDIVDKPWSFFRPFGERKLPRKKRLPKFDINSKDTWGERMSDKCMTEVLGSNDNNTKCLFSPLCINAMTNHHQVMYGPTHQVLFLTLAIILKCENKYSDILRNHSGVDVEGLIEDRCAEVFSEMSTIEKHGVDEDNRDLYMEQGFVCSIHGYEEFLNLKRLENILSWQRPNGCFGKERYDANDEEDEDLDVENIDRERERRNSESFRSMRRLLVDVILNHGCSAHESGVASGILGLYTKWLLTKIKAGSRAPTIRQDYQTPKHVSMRQVINNRNDDKINTKLIYITSMFLSFFITLLTLSIVFALKKYASDLCSGHSSKKYRPLVDA